MPDKRSFNAGLAAKGLEASISEEQARAMCVSQGRHSVLIVDARHASLTIAEDGTQRITLIADQVELIPEEHTARVRSFMRALYLARPEQHGQEAFEGAGENEPKVDDAAAQVDALVTRDDEGNETGIWSPEFTDAEPKTLHAVE